MDAAKSLPASPWDFRMRALVFGIIYGVGFAGGFFLQYIWFGSSQPTYAYIGASGGPAGIHAAAFIPVLLALAAQAIRLWGTAYLSSGVVWSARTTSTGLLLAGPYRYVRNPLYLGNIIAAVAIGLIGPPMVTALVVVGNVAFVLRLISVEERYLTAAHGQPYRDYCRTVPRLFPRFTPAPIEVDPQPPQWADAFWGEVFFLAFVVTALYNAIVTWAAPNSTMWIVFAAAMGLQSLIRMFASKRKTVTS
jgi:protein-S-isoprenylcysteine O-methyltransferase Ste14